MTAAHTRAGLQGAHCARTLAQTAPRPRSAKTDTDHHYHFPESVHWALSELQASYLNLITYQPV